MAIRDPQLAEWLLASLSSGLVAIDCSGRLTALNPAAQRILGGPDGEPDAWLGRDFREALGHRPQVIALLEDALDGRERPSRAELGLDADPGCPETIGFTLLPIRDDGGALRGAAIQFRDLSGFERVDEQERLRDRLAALGEMAAGLAHELRNPLAGMEVMAGLLLRRLDDGSEEHSLVLDLVGQLRTMAAALSETLEFVRPLAPETHDLDPVPLFELCVERATARVPVPAKVVRAFDEPLPHVVADPDQLLVALTDICVNALEAMQDLPAGREPRLEVGLCCEERPSPVGSVRVDGRTLPAGGPGEVRREVVFSVSDSGPGIPGDLRERIFYPFFTTKAGGSGVGLAKAQKVVNNHGGSIELRTDPARGTTFRVRLPARRGGS